MKTAGIVALAALLPAWLLVAVAGASSCPAGGCAGGQDVVLLQSRYQSSKGQSDKMDMEMPDVIHSGDKVMLAVGSGHRISVQEDGRVHAAWNHQGGWQQLTIEKVGGSEGTDKENMNSGSGRFFNADAKKMANDGFFKSVMADDAICDGDIVIFTGWTNKPITVQDKGVHAKWSHRGSWQRFVIESKDGPGPIAPGTTIFLRAHTGARIDADAPDSPGVVQARWNHKGSWQELVIEMKPQETSSTTPTKATTATTTTTTTTTTMSTTTTTTKRTDAACVPRGSLGKCEPCLKSEQCGEGRFCCPYLKKCVFSREGCYHPIANCRPSCYDSKNNEECTCGNADFPHRWQNQTCAMAK